jgi:hypothetical protein
MATWILQFRNALNLNFIGLGGVCGSSSLVDGFHSRDWVGLFTKEFVTAAKSE